jgi:GNAT superfamily N-acetyltransferase
MSVRRLDLTQNSADRAAAVSTWRAAFLDALPQLPPPRESRLRPDAPDGHHVALGAFEAADDDATAGLAVVNESRARTSAFWVAPAVRRRGIGSALLDGSRQLAKDAGHATLTVRMAGDAAVEGFAQVRGGRLASRDTMSGLDLGAVDRAAFEDLAGPDAGSGYALVRWSDRCPDELAAPFCTAMAAMADAPGDAYNTPLTVEALRAREQSLIRFGIHRHTQAVMAEDGEIAGFTNVVTVEDQPAVAEVWNTAVVRAHRGRGLSLRVKAAATLWMLDEHPQTRWMHTFNHEANARMLEVNRRLGYRPLVDWLNVEFDVA